MIFWPTPGLIRDNIWWLCSHSRWGRSVVLHCLDYILTNPWCDRENLWYLWISTAWISFLCRRGPRETATVFFRPAFRHRHHLLLHHHPFHHHFLLYDYMHTSCRQSVDPNFHSKTTGRTKWIKTLQLIHTQSSFIDGYRTISFQNKFCPKGEEIKTKTNLNHNRQLQNNTFSKQISSKREKRSKPKQTEIMEYCSVRFSCVA